MLFFEISNLNYAYNNEIILKNINLSYDNKDFLSIIGPNGAGKSTLVKLILGLLKSKNEIHFKALQRKEIGYVPQHTLANPNFWKKDKEKAMQALKSVGMEKFWNKTIDSLSGGQRQRVFIARALASECKMLILDEPTASVDNKSAIQIFELLSSLHQKGMGILLICHDINLVLAYSDKIAHLNKELFLHTNTKEKEKSSFLKHLYENHSHFCDVEMSLNTCFCDEENCDSKKLCEQEFTRRNLKKTEFKKENFCLKFSKENNA